MNPSLHLLEDEIFGLEMQQSVEISKPKRRTEQAAAARKLLRVDGLA